MKLKTIFKVAITLTIPIAMSLTAQARPLTNPKNTLIREENKENGYKNQLIMPYAFTSDSLGFTFGVGGGTKGYGQKQMLLGATAFYSSDEAVGLFLGMWDYRLPFADRVFFGAQGMVGHYPKQTAYSAVHFAPNTPRPGSNSSDKEQYGEDSGYDNWTDLKLEYVLPLGAARNDAMQNVHLKGGLLQSEALGGDSWNPLKYGVTTLMIRQYNRYRTFELDNEDIDVTTHPLQIAIGHNNTDLPGNPSAGSNQFLAVTHDFGWLESPDDWTFVEFEASKYLSFGGSDWARQRILALNMWTGDSTSWEETNNQDGTISVTHRPPFYEGSTLGGFYRMRAYPIDRFNDKAVIYATAEYRYTLQWNPIGAVSWLKFLKSDWLQLVAFAEGGRVANSYDGDLLKDWKVDGGFGLRSMFSGAVVRFDMAFSDESRSAWVMFGHPF